MKHLPLLLIVFAMPMLAAEPQTFESAATPPVLVELFSSEGCSSCPPAEAWMSALKSSPDLWKRVVPVVFHVDYWDRLGWPDRFASREFTARQARYAAAGRIASVYTPGFVVNGREWRGWFESKPLPAADAAKGGRLKVTLPDRAHAEIVFTPAAAGATPLFVEFALLGGGIESNVRRGENSGRKLRHDFVVLHFAHSALRAQDDRFTASLSLPEKMADQPVAVAAWVNAGDTQPPLQAAGGWLAR